MFDAIDILIDAGISNETVDSVIDEILVADEFGNDDDKRCFVALAWSRERGENTGPSDVSHNFGESVSIGNREFLVLTDDERETAWEENLDSYLDDGCVDGADSPYFDRDAWKNDARIDGAGHCLGSYDDNEYEYCVRRPNGIDGADTFEHWYIFRTN